MEIGMQKNESFIAKMDNKNYPGIVSRGHRSKTVGGVNDGCFKDKYCNGNCQKKFKRRPRRWNRGEKKRQHTWMKHNFLPEVNGNSAMFIPAH